MRRRVVVVALAVTAGLVPAIRAPLADARITTTQPTDTRLDAGDPDRVAAPVPDSFEDPEAPPVAARAVTGGPDKPGHDDDVRAEPQLRSPLSGPGRVPVRAIRLSRGINITNWFRFPPSRDPAALAAYLSNQALDQLRTAGFDFVRLAVDPALAGTRAEQAILLAAIRRIESRGLSVIVSPHPQDWHLETNPEPLQVFWHGFAPALRNLDQSRTIFEILNEPVFPNDPAGWQRLQHRVLSDIRAALPDATVVLTGQGWGGIAGLLALTPEDDPNVLYSFHFYDPAELTSLAAWRPGLDRAALARLPFPVTAACPGIADTAADQPTRDLMHYYCALNWNEARVAEPVARAAAWARQHHLRLLAGEFGASAALNPQARLSWLKTLRDRFATEGIPAALWGYDDVMGFAEHPAQGKRPVLDPAVLSALGLSRPM